MPNADNVKQTFTVDTGTFATTYTYSQDFSRRNKHNPWVWLSTSRVDEFPHFTSWLNDYAKGNLISFHITYNYNNLTHKPLHVYYKVDQGKASYSGQDTNRLGGDKGAGRKWIGANKKELNALAQACVDKGFA